MLPDHAIGCAKSTDAHLLRHDLPRVHCSVQNHRVFSGFTVESERVDVVKDKIALCGLIKLELHDLRAIFVGPLVDNFRDRFGRHETGLLLHFEEFIGGNADHEFDLTVDSCLPEWSNGDGCGFRTTTGSGTCWWG